MAIYITLKPSHPAGKMQRDGIVVSYVHPVILDEVPEGMKEDDYFEKKVINKKDVPELIEKGAIDMRKKAEIGAETKTLNPQSFPSISSSEAETEAEIEAKAE